MSSFTLINVACLLVALVAAVRVESSDSLKLTHNGPTSTLAPLISKTTPSGTLLSSASIFKKSSTTAPAITIKTSVTGEPNKPIGVSQPLTSAKPATSFVAKVTLAPAIVSGPIPHSTSKSLAGAPIAPVVAHATPAQKIGRYFEPICSQLDKLQPKQMFKIQSQLKQFVEKTLGRISICFMQQYSIDPNLAPITQPQLHTICSSRSLDKAAKGSFQGFQDCASHNYDSTLDAELDRIHKLRINCSTKHEHSKNDSLVSLTHDDDELSLISEVVNKVLTDAKGALIKPDIKVIDVGASGKPTSGPIHAGIVGTHTPAVAVMHPLPAGQQAMKAVENVTKAAGALGDKNKAAANILADQKILNDPNTLVLFVDDSVGNVTTAAPKNVVHSLAGAALAANATASTKLVAGTTLAPTKLVVPSVAPSQAALLTASTGKPAASIKIGAPATITVSTVAPAKTVIAATTSKPAGLADKIATAAGVKGVESTGGAAITKTTTVVTAAPHPATTTAPGVVVKTVTSTGKPAASTKKPSEAASTSAPSGSIGKLVVAASSTKKPVETIEQIMKQHRKEMADMEAKFKAEREKLVKQIQKKREDTDAKKAIKSLQMQRAQAHGSPSDVRMHQIEHERQMAIDPVGHSLKHKEYEQSKRLKAVASALAPSTTTKKPQ